MEEKEIGWSREVSLYLSDYGNLDAAANNVVNDLIDSLILGVVFDVHRAAKMGFLEEFTTTEEKNNFVLDENCMDVLGQKQVNKIMSHKCICPSCNRRLAAQIFAPHLSKCMGMGRYSARLASQRITSITQENIDKMDYHNSSRHRKKRDFNGKKISKNPKIGKSNENDNPQKSETCSDVNMDYENMSQVDLYPVPFSDQDQM